MVRFIKRFVICSLMSVPQPADRFEFQAGRFSFDNVSVILGLILANASKNLH